jgi:hypothetical protein
MLDHLEETVRRFILDVCAVMYNYGFAEVRVGDIMRLMGVPDDKAGEHDNELIILDETFERVIESYTQETKKDYSQDAPPAGTTLH